MLKIKIKEILQDSVNELDILLENSIAINDEYSKNLIEDFYNNTLTDEDEFNALTEEDEFNAI